MKNALGNKGLDKKDLILIVDFDGLHNQAIARIIRNKSVYCEVFPCDKSAVELRAAVEERNVKGIISVCAPRNDSPVYQAGVPVLSVCGDIAEDDEKLDNFLFDKSKCGCERNWNMGNFAMETIGALSEKLNDSKVLCALSGGVDSTVSALLIHKAIGNGLTCIFVDHGLMRLNEGDEVMRMFEGFGLNVKRVNAEERFLNKLRGIIDPEQKRKIIGEEFIRVFEEEAKKIGRVDYLAQGTIYPDIIESGAGKHAIVKSHHNVGGLPKVIDFKEIVEPLKDLFKDEVRACGIALGIPEKMVYRQPFPGPGIGVRVLGELTKEKLELLRKADFIFGDELIKAGLARSIWQYFAVLTDVKSVGMRKGGRVYGHTIALRAINTVDAMSAEYVKLPYDVLNAASERITTEIPEVVRVVYDITAKPPATIEWE